MAAVPPEARALLGLFLDAPAVVVEDLGASPAGRPAGVRAHPAHQIEASMWPPHTPWT